MGGAILWKPQNVKKECAIKYISEEIKQKERKYDKINDNLENRWDQSEGGIWWYKWKKQWLKKMWELGKRSKRAYTEINVK